MEVRLVGHNNERDPPKDHPCQVWCNLVQGFQRRNLNVKAYDVRQVMAKAHLWPGELKISQSETRIACGGHVC
jgi:hypothetical protein